VTLLPLLFFGVGAFRAPSEKGTGRRASRSLAVQRQAVAGRLSRPKTSLRHYVSERQPSRRARSGAGGEGAGVLDRLEGRTLGVRVGLDGARLRIGHRHYDIDVGQAAREDPEAAGRLAAGVQSLDH
jgi:hypothetical protein